MVWYMAVNIMDLPHKCISSIPGLSIVIIDLTLRITQSKTGPPPKMAGPVGAHETDKHNGSIVDPQMAQLLTTVGPGPVLAPGGISHLRWLKSGACGTYFF